MSIDPLIERPKPSLESPGDDGYDDSILQAQASIAIERWLVETPSVIEALREAVRAHIHVMELASHAHVAQQTRQDAEQRHAALLTRHDPAGRQILGFMGGLTLIVLLVAFDTIPLNWAAQAFGLDASGTWLVTLILLVASIGVMLGFELTSDHPRHRGLLAAVAGTAYLVLLGLRTQFLVTVAAESLPVALLQSTFLTALSVGLVLSGSVVLARTRSFGLSRSSAAAGRARRAATEACDAHTRAVRRLQRHIGGIRQILLPWALSSSAPAKVDRAKWAAALEQAISRLFPAS
jgi:hypothetical protein